MKDTCDNCQFLHTNQQDPNFPPVHECRRFPPSVMAQGIPQRTVAGGDMTIAWQRAASYPMTATNLWCGEFKVALAIRLS